MSKFYNKFMSTMLLPIIWVSDITVAAFGYLQTKSHSALLKYSYDLKDFNETQREVLEINRSYEDFRRGPLEISKRVRTESEKFSKSAEIYFLLKELSATYEMHSRKLPTQVFNEFRNVVDHFYRSIISSLDTEREEIHIKQMEFHLLRGAIDLSRLLCAALYEEVVSLTRRIDPKALALVNNGDFIEKLSIMRGQALQSIYEARKSSMANDSADRQIEQYINAVVTHNRMYVFFQENESSIFWAARKSFLFSGFGILLTVILGAAGSLLAALFLEFVTVEAVKQFVTRALP